MTITIAFILTRLREWGISMIRTSIVPPLAGWLLLQAVRYGVTVDSGTVQLVVLTVLTAVWYGVMRAVELVAANPRVVRIAGWLLGSPSAPAARLKAGDTEARALAPKVDPAV